MNEESKRCGARRVTQKEIHLPTVFMAPSAGKRVNTRPKLKCVNCGMVGHKKADCRKQKLRTDAHVCEINTELCFVAQDNADNSWYLDSGCTEHLTKSRDLLKNVRTLEKPIQIRSAKSGTFLIAREMGDLTVEAIVREQKNLVTINNVLLVPNLEFNLLSVRKLEMIGLKIVFENGKGNIYNKNKLIAVAHRE